MADVMRNPRMILACTLILALSGCGIATRVSRPKLTGYIYDADTRRPLAGCEVGSETTTDSNGYYELPQKVFREIAFIGGEGAPLFLHVDIKKRGYEWVVIRSYSTWGAPSPPAHWEVKPIFLKKFDDETREIWREKMPPHAWSDEDWQMWRDGRKPLPVPWREVSPTHR